MFLTPDQLRALTGRSRRPAQVRQLNFMGIAHKVRADGEIMVLKVYVEKEFGLGAEKVVKKRKVEPNWDSVT